METISFLMVKAAFTSFAQLHHITLKRYFEPSVCLIRFTRKIATYEKNCEFPFWIVSIPDQNNILLCSLFANVEHLSIIRVYYDEISNIHCVKKKLFWQNHIFRLNQTEYDKTYVLKKTVLEPS